MVSIPQDPPTKQLSPSYPQDLPLRGQRCDWAKELFAGRESFAEESQAHYEASLQKRFRYWFQLVHHADADNVECPYGCPHFRCLELYVFDKAAMRYYGVEFADKLLPWSWDGE